MESPEVKARRRVFLDLAVVLVHLGCPKIIVFDHRQELRHVVARGGVPPPVVAVRLEQRHFVLVFRVHAGKFNWR